MMLKIKNIALIMVTCCIVTMPSFVKAMDNDLSVGHGDEEFLSQYLIDTSMATAGAFWKCTGRPILSTARGALSIFPIKQVAGGIIVLVVVGYTWNYLTNRLEKATEKLVEGNENIQEKIENFEKMHEQQLQALDRQAQQLRENSVLLLQNVQELNKNFESLKNNFVENSEQHKNEILRKIEEHDGNILVAIVALKNEFGGLSGTMEANQKELMKSFQGINKSLDIFFGKINAVEGKLDRSIKNLENFSTQFNHNNQNLGNIFKSLRNPYHNNNPFFRT